MTTTTREVWTAPADQVILSAHEQDHHVSSDHAMIDSGTGYIVTCWDGEKVVHHYVNTGWGDGPFPEMPTPSATPEQHAAAKAYGAAGAFLAEVLKTAEKAHYIQVGSTVEVIKGRKAPKGRYEVTAHRNGNFGPYVDLRDEAGRAYRYISVENITVVADYAAAFRANPKTNLREFLPFFVRMMTEGSVLGAGVLADYIEENEVRFTGGHRAADFANALRVHAAHKKGLPFSTYYADCHNEFRRPFAGI